MVGRKKASPLHPNVHKKKECKKDDGGLGKRPKRQIVSKKLEQSAGLSWKEENDLKKALYASLHETKRLSRDPEDQPSSPCRSTRTLMGAPLYVPSSSSRMSMDDSSQDSLRSATSSSTQESKKTKVHAQRKFAQGQSQPGTPNTTPVKTHTTPVKLFPKRAKTEDFLTFLCLRGSSALPPHLDFFGYSRDDSQHGENSRPATPGQPVRSDNGETRESTPDLYSSSDSDMRDEVPELANLMIKAQQTPTRKAARASASTPETARGLASIRPSVSKKAQGKVPAKALLKRSRKMLLSSPNKTSPQGKRPRLRRQRSPSKLVSSWPCSIDSFFSGQQDCFEAGEPVVNPSSLAKPKTHSSKKKLSTSSGKAGKHSPKRPLTPGKSSPLKAGLDEPLYFGVESRPAGGKNRKRNCSVTSAVGSHITPVTEWVAVPSSKYGEGSFSSATWIDVVSPECCGGLKPLLSSSCTYTQNLAHTPNLDVVTRLGLCPEPSFSSVVAGRKPVAHASIFPLPAPPYSALVHIPPTSSSNTLYSQIALSTTMPASCSSLLDHTYTQLPSTSVTNPYSVNNSIAPREKALDCDSLESDLGSYVSTSSLPPYHLSHCQWMEENGPLFPPDISYHGEATPSDFPLEIPSFESLTAPFPYSNYLIDPLLCTGNPAVIGPSELVDVHDPATSTDEDHPPEYATLKPLSPSLGCMCQTEHDFLELQTSDVSVNMNISQSSDSLEKILLVSVMSDFESPEPTVNSCEPEFKFSMPKPLAEPAISTAVPESGKIGLAVTSSETEFKFAMPKPWTGPAISTVVPEIGQIGLAVKSSEIEFKFATPKPWTEPVSTAAGRTDQYRGQTPLQTSVDWPVLLGKFSLASSPAYMRPPESGQFLYPLPPVLVSPMVFQSPGNGSEIDSPSSKPVRASATPSKKRITPQSLLIGDLPKFLIDESDSSRDSREFPSGLVRRGRPPGSVGKLQPSPARKIFIAKKRGRPRQEQTQLDDEIFVMHKHRKVEKTSLCGLSFKAGKLKVAKAAGKRKRADVKEKLGPRGRKKRAATLLKNYAENDDVEDIEITFDLPTNLKSVRKPLAKPSKLRNQKSESRRKTVAASLAKLAATKKLSQIRKKTQTAKNKSELPVDVSSAIARKARQARAAKIKDWSELRNGGARKGDAKSDGSSTSTPKRRGRPSVQTTPTSGQEMSTKTFPSPEDGGHIVDVPTFYPTAKEFQDPLKYIASIRSRAESYGMCKVIPPSSWKPECKVNDELRFTSQLQCIHQMRNRWGPNVQQMGCIQKHLASINVEMEQPPLIGGIEVDLPKLHQTIQVFGGAQNVVEKKTWIKVADAMKIPKLAQDRATKLYDAYCKYLLSYDTLSYEEKTRLEHQVWIERQRKVKSAQGTEESVKKGKSMSLGDFNRIARNTVSMWFKEDPTVEQVQSEYWKVVEDGQSHVVVQCGHVDTRSQGSAFPYKRDSPCSRHGWNFNVLPQNSGTVLKSMGPVTGVTIPTMHIGMLFTTSCWSTDLHLLPYIQYLHSGADIVWHAVPQSEEGKFKSALTSTVPELVSDNAVWLSEDTVMVSPDTLSQKGVSLCRCVQKQGQFMVVFSRCHTATISCGYSLSESVHFAYPDWIQLGVEAAKRLNESYEPELFAMEGLLCNLAKESTDKKTVVTVLPLLQDVVQTELKKARQIVDEGVKTKQMYVLKEPFSLSSASKKKSLDSIGKSDCVCDICKKVCHLYMVVNDLEDSVYCLDHGASHIQKKKNLKVCKLLFRYTQDELLELVKLVQERLTELMTKGSTKQNVARTKRNKGSTKKNNAKQNINGAKANVVGPKQNVAGTKLNVANPKPNSDTILNIASAKPSVPSTKPNIPGTKPTVTSTKPSLPSTKQNVISTKSNIVAAKASVASTKPAVTSTKLTVSSAKPTVTSTSSPATSPEDGQKRRSVTLRSSTQGGGTM